MESPEVRELRRALSASLTGSINDVTTQFAIRIQVIKALAALNQRFDELNQYARENFLLDPGRVLVRFYMKGGNAFKCVYDPQGREATEFGGGNSDWDTQAIVDPWAPLPIQALLYARIEEIITDEMVKAGVGIADVAKPAFPPSPAQLIVKDVRQVDMTYEVTSDDPQTLRQVYDYNHIGMWMNDRRKLNDELVTDTALIPGILLNDAIPSFALHRLGYTWHAEPVASSNGIPPKIARPVLMELIDVTLPRRDTIEAVSVWEELEAKILVVTPTQVGVSVGVPQAVNETLPLPEIPYHLHEIATMLCEIADGSSRHQDKLPKRFERFAQIVNSGRMAPEAVDHLLSALAGVGGILAQKDVPNQQVTNVIQQYAPNYLNSQDPAVLLARKLMDIVASRTPVYLDRPKFLFLAAREALKFLCSLLELGPYVVDGAFSDDLVLRDLIAENGYVQVDKVKSSEIDQQVILRIKPQVDLESVADILKSVFGSGKKRKLSDIDWSSVGLIADERVRRILLDLARGNLSIRSRSHNTVRPSGITNEQTFVIFNNGRAVICITLTTATPAEAPFRPAPRDAGTLYASLPELANQRKVAAALIEDYTIRAAISQQYDVLKRLLAGI
jgi:hypothetical protein